MNDEDRDTQPPSAPDARATAFSRLEGKVDELIGLVKALVGDHENRLRRLEGRDTDPHELNGHG